MSKKAEDALSDELAGSGVFIVDIEFEGEAPDDEESSNASTGDTMTTIHRFVSGLYEAGVFDKATMRKFDEMCLTPVGPMDPKAIRELREESGVSQAVLAKVLNVTTNAVGQWERGEKKPTGSALKLLALVREKGLSAVL